MSSRRVVHCVLLKVCPFLWKRFTVLHTQLPNKQRAEPLCTSALPPVTLWALKAVHLHLAVQPQCLHSHSLTIQQIQQFMIKEHKGFQAEIGTALLSLGCCCMRTQELISKVPAEREIISDPAKTALLYPQVPLSSSAL